MVGTAPTPATPLSAHALLTLEPGGRYLAQAQEQHRCQPVVRLNEAAVGGCRDVLRADDTSEGSDMGRCLKC